MAERSDIPNANAQEEKFPLLPRQAWNSELAYLKAMLKAKQALDQTEKALIKNSSKSA